MSELQQEREGVSSSLEISPVAKPANAISDFIATPNLGGSHCSARLRLTEDM